MAKTLAQLEAEKKANSAAWHTASQADRDRLHAANQEIQKQIDSMSGSTSSFDDKSGTWTTAPNRRPSGGGSGGGGGTPSSGGLPSGFQGSAAGVQTSTSQQEQWRQEMNDNSAKWHTADDAAKKELEERNKYLAGLMGGSVNFDSGSGTWSGAAEQPKPQGPQTGGVNDYSDYIEAMNRAQREAALAALRAAYEKNVAGLDRTQAGIAPQYQSARNQAAGQSEQRKRAFAEYAAAQGLNSGAGGQAMLAMGNALQNSLSGIGQAEASTMADLELQRSQMETDYNNAIAQAEAQGNYELAQQLYQEKVRQDEALRQQMQWQAQMDLQRQQMQFQQGQADISNQQWNQQFQSGEGQWNRQWAYQQAQELARYGDFSGYKALGYSDEQIQGMKDAYEYRRQPAAAQAAGTGGGGSSGGTGGTEKPVLTYANMMNAVESGNITPAVRAAWQYYMGEPWQQEEKTVQGGTITDISQCGPAAQSILSSAARGNASAGSIAAKVDEALKTGAITDAEADFILRSIGY